jgi:hypothetical protein
LASSDQGCGLNEVRPRLIEMVKRLLEGAASRMLAKWCVWSVIWLLNDTPMR